MSISLPTMSKSLPTMSMKLITKHFTVEGTSFGAEVPAHGELVFSTAMVGYPQALTDPSFYGQILVLTFPLVGNYGVPLDCDKNSNHLNLDNLETHLNSTFESNKIHIAGLVVQSYADDFSHFTAKKSLGDWLKEHGIPAIFGVDTRMLTKKIRNSGDIHCQLLPDGVKPLAFVNQPNLVKLVSRKDKIVLQPKTFTLTQDGKRINILAIDVGMKYNQIRCFLNRGVILTIVPWDYDFLKEDFDGLFISNGPGDPSTLTETIARIKKQLELKTKPVFGICLGHQLMALASGATTEKMPFGNRGINIPVTCQFSGKCYITSQNHGYAVKSSTIQKGWKELFRNANDDSNEGLISEELPYVSVQFHPESRPGPWDTEFLFDDFISLVKECKELNRVVPAKLPKVIKFPERVYPKKVLILGSGGLSIGQAGEFDYSGSQAIKALKEEGIFTILINPNIATIQTSSGLADKVYFLPVTPDFVRKVIQYEKPDGIYCTFGGQTALNVGVKLNSEFESLGVKVLGTPIESILITEDRELFNEMLAEIGEKTAMSFAATSFEEARIAANKIGYPLIIRAAFALGGLGSGFAYNEKDLKNLCTKAFAISTQVLVERSMKGWKEVEYEVVRDCHDNCITVCNMENFDPLGIHTGDSIVVAPSQTLSDDDYMMLRQTAINVIRRIGVVGECNIQYALNPHSKEYCIIEVNARLSRSSALASKATGYPLAFVAAKLGLNIPLTEVKNSVTKKTVACFEPSLDYCVVKMPRWDLKKFNRVSTKISSAMKSVGEVMAIGRNFEETIQKAIRAVEYSFMGFSPYLITGSLDEELQNPTDQRLLAIANAFHAGYTVDKVHELTDIDKWFLVRLKRISDFEKELNSFDHISIPRSYMNKAKQIGFSDRQIAKALSNTELAIRKVRKEMKITPFVKQIDTVAAEFPCYTNYLYTTYNGSEHDIEFNDNAVIVLGSGVYRIGSSVEFDWCAVRCIRTLRSLGHKTIMINYNPETVSTDFDEADRLYFENLTLETVMDIYELENSKGVIVCMGGQSPNNIALSLFRENVKILGTSPVMIDNAENRYKFSRMCDKIGVDQPQWKELTSAEEASIFCKKVEYPVLVRPSYVLSGAGMTVVNSEADLKTYLIQAGTVSREFPVVISKFIEDAKEIEMDAVANEGKLIMHVITEHVENAGVHSGDATLILPPQDLDPETVKKIELATAKIVAELHVTGPCNIQFIAKNNEIKIIECNVRASRSFPFVSKVLGVDLVELATRSIMNEPFETYPTPTLKPNTVAVKVPQFSFSRLAGADPILGVEMASTGEVACFGPNKYEAYLKALIATGFVVPKKNILISIGSFKEKLEFLPSVKTLQEMGFSLFATAGTSDFLQEHDVKCKYLESLDEEDEKNPQKLEYSLDQHLANNLIDLYINLPSKNQYRRPASYMSRGYRSRRMAVDLAIPLITNIKCAKLFVSAISRRPKFEVSTVDCQTSHVTYILPGLVNVSPVQMMPGVALKAGITFLANTPSEKQFYADFSLSTQDVNRYGASLLITESNLGIAFKEWKGKFISTAEYLSSVLLYSNLYEKAVHITQVSNFEDLQLILLSKEKGVNVTFDVDIHDLFSNQFLWDYFDEIDCLSIGKEQECAVLLLLNAVRDKKIKMEDISEKMSANPRKIFDIPEQHDTFIEVELDAATTTPGQRRFGSVHRVVMHGKTGFHFLTQVFLSGELFGECAGLQEPHTPLLAMQSPHKRVSVPPASPVRYPAVSTDKGPRTRLFSDSNAGHRSEGAVEVRRQSIPSFTVPSYSRMATPTFSKKHIISVNQFQRSDLHILFGVAEEMKLSVEKQGKLSMLDGKVMCSAFWEPSTRTSCSFETAMVRLGGSVISINQITSSISKGESLSDTVRTLATYGDVIVMRHSMPGSADVAKKVSPVPVINAGDGIGEHPTQALLDIYTIREELGTVNGLTITLVGDLLNGRTVHSLVKLITLYSVKINYVSPKSLSMPKDIIDLVAKYGITQYETSDLTSVIPETDVLYVTRIQKERFASEEDYNLVKDSYKITNSVLKRAKDHMIVMHPLPRINEIDPEVDFDPRAAYFRQMRYGLYVRMALLLLVLGQ